MLEKIIPDKEKRQAFEKKVASYYQEPGASVRNVSKKLKKEGVPICYETIRNLLRNTGRKINPKYRHNPVTETEASKIIFLYDEGLSTRQIVRIVRRGCTTIRDVLIQDGREIRSTSCYKTGKKPKSARKKREIV